LLGEMELTSRLLPVRNAPHRKSFITKLVFWDTGKGEIKC
jgi:hypothetical protein